MSLKARFRIAIVVLITLVVVAMAALYLYDFTQMAFDSATKRAELVAKEVKGYLIERVNQQMDARDIHAASPEESKKEFTGIVKSDPNIQDMLNRTFASDN